MVRHRASNPYEQSATAGMATQPNVELSIGTLSPEGYAFSPLTAISKYPYQFIKGKDLQAEVAANFFSEGRFWRRTWRV